MKVNRPSPLDKKSELLKYKKEKEKEKEKDEEEEDSDDKDSDDSDEEEEEEDDSDDDEIEEKTKNTKQHPIKSNLNKDLKTKTNETKSKISSQISSNIIKSKLLINKKDDINRPKETNININNNANSLRKQFLERKLQKEMKPLQNITQAQSKILINQINPLQTKIQVQTKPQIQTQIQSKIQTKYFRRVIDPKENTIINNNEINKNNNEINSNKNNIINNKEKEENIKEDNNNENIEKKK